MLFYRVSQAVVSFILINYVSVECFSIFISDFVALGALFLSIRMGCAKLLLIVCLLMSWWFMTSVSAQDSIFVSCCCESSYGIHSRSTSDRNCYVVACELTSRLLSCSVLCVFVFIFPCRLLSVILCGQTFLQQASVDVWFFADWRTEILMASTVELVIWWCCAMSTCGFAGVFGTCCNSWIIHSRQMGGSFCVCLWYVCMLGVLLILILNCVVFSFQCCYHEVSQIGIRINANSFPVSFGSSQYQRTTVCGSRTDVRSFGCPRVLYQLLSMMSLCGR